MRPPRDDLQFFNTTGILQKKTMCFIGVEVEQETSAPSPKKNPGSAPATQFDSNTRLLCEISDTYGLQQLITKPTRITESSTSLIDVIFTNINEQDSLFRSFACWH